MNGVAVMGWLWCGIGLALIIGVSLHDIRAVWRQQAQRRHPHARRYRQRPLVSVISDGSSLVLRRQLGYRNHEWIDAAHTPRGEYILQLNGHFIPNDALRRAVITLASQPAMRHVELPRRLSAPTTLWQLLANYRTIAGDLALKARGGLNIYPASASTVLLRRQQIRPTIADYCYRGIGVIALPTVAYGGAMAVSMALLFRQPQLLMAVLTGWGLWLGLAILWHDQLTTRQKLGYLAVAPVSLGYFVVVFVDLLLKVLTHMSKAIFHRGVGLFVRVKDVLWIVK